MTGGWILGPGLCEEILWGPRPLPSWSIIEKGCILRPGALVLSWSCWKEAFRLLDRW